MKTSLIPLIAFFFLCFSCDKIDEVIIPTIEETTAHGFLKIIDFSSSITEDSEIEDFDVEDGYIYFIYSKSIYRINLNSESNIAEHLIEDTLDWPATLKVIGNILYYQGDGSYSLSTDIKQMDLNNISGGVQSTNSILGSSRSEFCKNADKLLYVSSPNGLSPINNLYELNQSSSDQLIATEEYVHLENMRVVDNYLYFSSVKEIRKLDLNNPTEKSSIVYTIPDIADSFFSDNDILGFDIKDNIIYLTQISNNKLLSINLEKPNEDPIILKTNSNHGVTGYSKMIISNGKLYVKKLSDKQLEVFEI
tara:strand:+ start:1866 stop:2786 length:921 start_codon:yes stop_codon:yes gene_type:complete